MDNNYNVLFLDEKNQKSRLHFLAKIKNKILKSPETRAKTFPTLSQTAGISLRISFSIFYAYETDVKIKIFDFY